MKFAVCLCFNLLIWNVQAWSPTNRLQRDAFPKSYSLKIVPIALNNTFMGEVTILMSIEHSINNITLNSRNLFIDEITLDQAIGQTKHLLDPKKEFLHVSYTDEDYIDPGEHILNIKFRGSLKGSFGFYSLKIRNGRNKSTMFVTKFSSIHARSAFPCFDEPFFKSIFTLRLVKPDETWIALSNMYETANFRTPEGIAVDFRSTVPMSTYLLAWGLIDFTYDAEEYRSKDKIIPLRFFSQERSRKGRRKALEVTKKTLQFFENYTDIPYALPKLDSIEVPNYRSRGMEHWGLIIYQANSILHNSESLTSALYHSIEATTLIAHEVSHMWFGNLVTHAWYNDLWLTEGFARFMQYKAAFAIIEEPFVKKLFQNNKLLSLFQLRCGNTLKTETASYTRNLDDIMKKFGSSTYDQGAGILFMLEDLIGPLKFQEAVRLHIKNNQYKFASTADFLNTVQNVQPTVSIRNFMETYLFQKKLPLISVTDEIGYYVLTQSPLCDNDNKSIFRDKWTIPLKFITSSNRTSRFVWFDKDMISTKIPKSKNDTWIKVNHLNVGLYRSLYTDEIYQGLLEDFQSLDKDDQNALMEETFYWPPMKSCLAMFLCSFFRK
ncbi:hypothetical protein HHI36_001120 [Cryptolaemus montrouzieri]|uniref:Uncharacterized protein n=1 Tax=Cryptolaemus montrouzieri TaxID=559131 RepID=A0ABD2P6R2_9CUCU